MLVGGSVHPGEDEALVDAHRTLAAAHPGLRLILVPRHPERFDRAEEVVRKAGLVCHRRTAGTPPPGEAPVLSAVEVSKTYRLGRVDVPVLRKDFTRNAAQIWEARASGADAVLLIVATLSDATLAELVAEANDVGVDAIVEAHTIPEVLRAGGAGAKIIGVNNRDLTTFTTDLSVAEASADAMPSDVVRIAESGVSSRQGAARMRAAGSDAIRVGEALVRHRDPMRVVAELAGVA